MRKATASLGTAVFFVVAPGTVTGVIPWLISRWEFREPLPYWAAAQAVGVLLICAGVVPLASAMAEFARARGIPMPLTPTRHLVVAGFNRYVRNPMYVGLLLIVLGQALLFGQLNLVWYAAVIWIVTASFVRWYEEPLLARLFGTEFEEYRRAVRAWVPRLRPWYPTATGAR